MTVKLVKPQRDQDGHRRQVRRVEPPSFAWTEPLAEAKPPERPAKTVKPQVVVIGRGPSVGNRMARALPNPMAAAASIAVIFAGLIGIALISPSGDNATAARTSAPLKRAIADSEAARLATKKAIPINKATSEVAAAEARDPFARDGFAAEVLATKRKAAAQAKAKAKHAATLRAARFKAEFTFYSSYTPWEKLTRPAGSWLDFDGKPTLKFVSVDKTGANVYVVSDVELLEDESKRYSYQYPVRMLHVKPGAVVRFADYRDIQGDDVTYTLRYSASSKR